jgi:hypothetical protein
MSFIDELERLQALRAQGAISEAEFAAGKQLLLSGQPAIPPLPAELPPMAEQPPGNSRQSTPSNFDWSRISEDSAAKSSAPPITAKMLSDTLLKCVFTGAMIGMAVANIASLGVTRGLLLGGLAGAFAWTPLAITVETVRGSKTAAARFLRFVHGLLCLASVISLIYMLCIAYYVYIERGGTVVEPPTVPRALIN